jgi:hypothetical protein
MSTTPRHHANRDQDHADDQMLNIEEAAAYLRVPVATMRYWRHTGDGPFSFKIGRHVRYWRSDLILWRAEQAHRPQERP